MAEPFDEDADVRSYLAPGALAELRGILEVPSVDRTLVFRAIGATGLGRSRHR